MKVRSVPDDTCSPEDERRFDDAEVDSPRPAAIWQAWLEMAVLAALATSASLTLHLGLPWLALAPLLVGVRYGAGPGVACAAAQVAALMVAARWGVARWGVAIEAPGGQAILGWLIAGLVPGQFRDAWTRRLHRLEAHARDARQRLRGLARAYHLMAASHDHLQREIAGSPSSLRDALEVFAREVVESPAGGAAEPLAERILAVLRTHASVRAATFHLVDAGGRAGPAVATLGTAPSCDDDPLIRHAVRLGEVVSVRDLPGCSGALVAIPLADVAGCVHAVVAVHELPFLALHHDTLRLFAVLGGHLGDVMARARDASRAVAAQPTHAFCASARRALHELRRYGIPAALAIVELEASPGETHVPRLLARCLAAHRRLGDDAEIVVGGGRTVRVVVLLRLTGALGLRSYLARLEQVARLRAHELGTRCEIRLRGWSLDEVPLPGRGSQLEIGLAALLNNAALPSGTSLPRRHHDVMA
jgi:hypothetical protein